MTRPTRSIYTMSKDEIAKGIANRFVHSRSYIILYLAMAALSVTTVVLSLTNDCPTLPFYILELIINGAMILEVSIRVVAFGRVRAQLKMIFYTSDRSFHHAAILEVGLQHHGSHSHSILCYNPSCYFPLGLQRSQ